MHGREEKIIHSFIRQHEGKRAVARYRCRRKNNVTVELNEI
jgi:hypothetical protein